MNMYDWTYAVPAGGGGGGEVGGGEVGGGVASEINK